MSLLITENIPILFTYLYLKDPNWNFDNCSQDEHKRFALLKPSNEHSLAV